MAHGLQRTHLLGHCAGIHVVHALGGALGGESREALHLLLPSLGMLAALGASRRQHRYRRPDKWNRLQHVRCRRPLTCVQRGCESPLQNNPAIALFPFSAPPKYLAPPPSRPGRPKNTPRRRDTGRPAGLLLVHFVSPKPPCCLPQSHEWLA